MRDGINLARVIERDKAAQITLSSKMAFTSTRPRKLLVVHKKQVVKVHTVKKNFPLHLKKPEWRWSEEFDTLVVEIKQMMV